MTEPWIVELRIPHDLMTILVERAEKSGGTLGQMVLALVSSGLEAERKGREPHVRTKKR